jgi:hypothetical protein
MNDGEMKKESLNNKTYNLCYFYVAPKLTLHWSADLGA